jgi:hypothetical protein
MRGKPRNIGNVPRRKDGHPTILAPPPYPLGLDGQAHLAFYTIYIFCVRYGTWQLRYIVHFEIWARGHAYGIR